MHRPERPGQDADSPARMPVGRPDRPTRPPAVRLPLCRDRSTLGPTKRRVDPTRHIGVDRVKPLSDVLASLLRHVFGNGRRVEFASRDPQPLRQGVGKGKHVIRYRDRCLHTTVILQYDYTINPSPRAGDFCLSADERMFTAIHDTQKSERVLHEVDQAGDSTLQNFVGHADATVSVTPCDNFRAQPGPLDQFPSRGRVSRVPRPARPPPRRSAPRRSRAGAAAGSRSSPPAASARPSPPAFRCTAGNVPSARPRS